MSDNICTLEILKYPDPALRKTARDICAATSQIKMLAEKMLSLMNEAEGIGLAATQLGVELRLIVADVLHDGSPPLMLANPVVELASKETCKNEEGCLSMPGVRAMVTRPAQIEVSALDIEGRKVTLKADGLFATCLQHEIDHLDGKLFIDRLSRLRRNMVLAQYRKLLKKQAEEEN